MIGQLLNDVFKELNDVKFKEKHYSVKELQNYGVISLCIINSFAKKNEIK
jgi:hypothetical protein